jgi:macrolide transport system ATP-binding/permease protein
MRLFRFFRLRRRPSEAEIARELRDHLELDAGEIASGSGDPDDARLRARRRFGNVSLVQEATREAWGSLWLERLEQDVRFGLRMLRRTPVFSLVAVTCLALGIGANAAVLSWTEGIVHHPFPGVVDQDQLVAVVGTAKGASGFDEMSWPDFMDLSRGTTAFQSFIVSKITGTTLTGGDRAESAVGQLVTANYFDALGLRPLLGRGFLPGEDIGRGAHPVTVISYRLWKDRFAGDPRVIGSTINYNGVPHTIVGVTPEIFLGTFVGYAMQFWVPASQQAVFDASGYKLDDRTARWMEGFARLKPGVALAQGQAQIDAAARRLEAEFPNADRGRGVRILPLDENPFDNAKVLRPMLRVGSLVAAMVLLIVCANIANLLLVRSLARRGEITVRRALGAGRARLMRQLITEGLILAIVGTAAGLLVAYLSRNLLALFFAPRGGVSLVFAADFNWRVLATTIALGLASTVIFALIPALQTVHLDLASALRAAAPGAVGSGSRARLRSVLVLVQLCLSVVLLIGAGLMVTSLRRLLTTNPGFATTTVTTTGVNLFATGYDTARAHQFEDELLERVATMGKGSSVALARSLPFAPRPYDNGPILVDGYQASRDEQPTADYNPVTPGYFGTLGIPLLSGRDFTVADADTSAPVAIVSQAMAIRYWPNASPVGKRLELRNKWMRVVGVVGDIKYRSLTEAPAMLFYVPLAQNRPTAVNLFIRTPQSGATPMLAPRIVAAIHAVDPNVSPYEILTLREQVNRSTSGQQIMVTLLVIFSSVALVLAAIGLYGVISYMVSQSTRELGLRTALGATPTQLIQLIMSLGLRLTALGVVLGLLVALGTTRLLGDLLFRVSPRDPTVIGGVVILMGTASVLACLVPAWRAARIDPVRALRM